MRVDHVCRALTIMSLCLAAACGRASAASFVPSLELRLSAERSQDGASRRAPWSAVFFTSFGLEPRPASQFLPTRAEFDPALALTPCDPDDTTCIEEAAENEEELANLLGEIQ